MKTNLFAVGLVVMSMVVGCKKGDDGAGGGTRSSPEDCQNAYDHLAELDAKRGTATKEEILKSQQGNIEHCPKMVSRAGIDCMLAMTAYSMNAWQDCIMKK